VETNKDSIQIIIKMLPPEFFGVSPVLSCTSPPQYHSPVPNRRYLTTPLINSRHVIQICLGSSSRNVPWRQSCSTSSCSRLPWRPAHGYQQYPAVWCPHRILGPDKYYLQEPQIHEPQPKCFDRKVSTDLNLRRIREVQPNHPVHSYPHHLAWSRSRNKWRTIHHLSCPQENRSTTPSTLESGTLQIRVFERSCPWSSKAGRNCTMLKRDMKDAFRMIPIAPQHHWLMDSLGRQILCPNRCSPSAYVQLPSSSTSSPKPGNGS